jgi:hypothetical protein
MFRGIRLSWARAKALSVLQNAYEMPLREPLDRLDDLDLRQVTATAFDAGGNAFDAAAAFMTYRIKAAFLADLDADHQVVKEARRDLSKLVLGLTRTSELTKFKSLHWATLRELGELSKRGAGGTLGMVPKREP